ncbi:tyrosinase [Paucimonas lemoignei]|uniref:Tyrosinase n=1 Tax=Paucimonas lemoignei TaxID=29443 RepID=A0A4V6NY19_PAULE|nr:tyrosinase family protein [Paucimonas lemoignei]TCS39670.1 tyrosinase [Paucimonas lemoignei]
MTVHRFSRRAFLQGSVSALALSSLPSLPAFAQNAVRVRPEWQEFRGTSAYASFIDAIRTMRANTNASSRASLQYWADAHGAFGLHSAPHFLGWHRAFLYAFEQQLRIVSGNNSLVVPYWDYYRNPQIPAEFTDPATGNPLYMPRMNTNVFNALSLAPFASNIRNFQRGTSNAFEPLLEDAPHNPVHNIIGGIMGSVAQAPQDILFFLHHANIDRLWHAWAMPDGKGIPWTSSPYWSGSYRVTSDWAVPRAQCYHPNWLGSDYSSTALPTALPAQAMTKGRVIRVQAQAGRRRGRPPIGDFATTGPRAIDAGRRSLGGARDIGLSENSVSVQVPLRGAETDTVQTIAIRARGKKAGKPFPSTGYKSISIVLDDIKVLPAGKAGGYFYKVYLNLPENGDSSDTESRHLLGTVGAFEVGAATHHAHHGGQSGSGAPQLVFPATEALANISADEYKNLTVSLVRVSGDNAPKGRAISVGEVRVEASTDEPYDTTPNAPAPAGSPYKR